MAKIIFPSEPENGMIFEAAPGLFYQFDSSTNCWVRIDGVDSLGLATDLSDGLMSPDDLRKLNELIFPPPQTSLKGEDCGIIFDSGTIRLVSTDRSVNIEHTRDVINQGTVEKLPWQIHNNTAGYDFTLNIDQFIEKLEEENQLTKIQIQGKEGPRGDPGEDGVDRLDTGPVGPAGEDGQPSVFGGSLQPEVINIEVLEDLKNRAIVDITTEESEDGNFLVVTRANVGDPEACLELVSGGFFESPWVVAIDESSPTITRQFIKTDDCTIPCLICNTSLHHLYIKPIINALNNRFIELTLKLRDEKERLFKIWMEALIQLFNEQKSSLCCALENCTTRKRNTDDRRYIEQQRIQASHSQHNLLIDGEEDRVIIDTNVSKDCDDVPITCNIINNCDLGLECTVSEETIQVPFGSRWNFSINNGPFSTALAPFGSSTPAGAPHQDLGRRAASPFPLGSTLTLRRSLGENVTSMSVTYQVDDFADVFVNGIQVSDEPDTGDAGRIRPPITFQVPSSVFNEGENEITIVARDSGRLFSWIDVSLTYTRTVVQCELPDDLPIIVNPFLNRIEWDEGCGMDIRVTVPQLVRLTKTLGSPDSFELADPGDGLTLGADFNKIYISARKSVDELTFRPRLIDSNFNIYSFPFKTVSDIDQFEFIEFNADELSATDANGGSISGILDKDTTIIAIILEVDAQAVKGVSENTTVLTTSSISLLDVTGDVSVLAGFEWNGDSDALRQVWNVECEAEQVTSLCSSCLLTSVVNPAIHFNNERALLINIPQGDYELEITGCCAELANNIFSGRVFVEYQSEEIIGGETTTVPIQDSISDLGNFTSEQQARLAYIGSTLGFTHAGGQIKLWIQDANGIVVDNAGAIEVCLRPQLCATIDDITAASEDDAIFVYIDSIAPNNLLGFINPFGGTLTAIDNYNYAGGSDPEGADIIEGPAVESSATQIWFYNSIDGLSAFIINGPTQDPNTVGLDIKTTGNNEAQSVLVADDPGEISTLASTAVESTFSADWSYSNDTDGAVIGAFDNSDDAGWVFEITPRDLGISNRLVALSSAGNSIELAFATDGIGTELSANKIIFTRLVNGCQMFHKQVDWLERGHRIGAACSAVVTVEGTKYIIVKRSIGTDTTCGGGETLSNQCVSTFINSGEGHPAIAWPTFNNLEFIGKPTSGFQGFVQDPELSDKVLEKLASGDIEEPVNGDPAGQIPFVLFPSNI